ncbi:hypothetical protein LCGC14_0415800 [marine sediment metagenome]|uniref:Uncharacterized protein n=1 Tax=marine sediment metagenome TaxID=412755 RepID=A0A0F9SYE8_9ZZZZ
MNGELQSRITDLEQQLEAAEKETNLWKLRVDEAGDYINDYEEIQADLAAKTDALEKIKPYLLECQSCFIAYAKEGTHHGSRDTTKFWETKAKAIGLIIKATAALAPCETCGGSGFKPREKHCSYKSRLCHKIHDGITCKPNGVWCEYYIHSELCPACTDKENQ